jgi:hypothetical protein
MFGVCSWSQVENFGKVEHLGRAINLLVATHWTKRRLWNVTSTLSGYSLSLLSPITMNPVSSILSFCVLSWLELPQQFLDECRNTGSHHGIVLIDSPKIKTPSELYRYSVNSTLLSTSINRSALFCIRNLTQYEDPWVGVDTDNLAHDTWKLTSPLVESDYVLPNN